MRYSKRILIATLPVMLIADETRTVKMRDDCQPGYVQPATGGWRRTEHV